MSRSFGVRNYRNRFTILRFIVVMLSTITVALSFYFFFQINLNQNRNINVLPELHQYVLIIAQTGTIFTVISNQNNICHIFTNKNIVTVFLYIPVHFDPCIRSFNIHSFIRQLSSFEVQLFLRNPLTKPIFSFYIRNEPLLKKKGGGRSLLETKQMKC